MDLLISGGTAFLSGILLYNLRNDERNLQSYIEKLSLLKCLSPSALLKIFSDWDNKLKQHNFVDDGENIRGNVIVEGYAHSTKPLTNKYNETKLVYKEQYQENILQSGYNYLQNNSIYRAEKDNVSIQSQYASNFHIKDINQTDSCQVIPNTATKILFDLSTIHKKKVLNSESLMKKSSVVIKQLLSKLMLNYWELYSQDVQVGHNHVLKGIQLNEFIMIFGEFIFNKKAKQMFIKFPKFIMKNQKQLINFFKLQISRNKKWQYFFKFVFLVSSLFFIYRTVKRIQNIIKEKINEKNREKNRIMLDKLACVVCLDQFRNLILKPCNHMCICKTCYEKVNGICPVCKTKITDFQEVFIS